MNDRLSSAWIKRLAKIVLIAMLATATAGGCQKEPPPSEPRAKPVGAFLVGPSNICMPVGRIMLIRFAGRINGVVVREAHYDSAKHSYLATVTTLNEEREGVWRADDRRVEEGPLTGIGHPFMFQTGNVRLDFHSFALEFNGPTCVSMYPYHTSEGDHGLLFAPTAWMDVARVRPTDKSLSWYRVDLNRSTDVAVAGLPGPWFAVATSKGTDELTSVVGLDGQAEAEAAVPPSATQIQQIMNGVKWWRGATTFLLLLLVSGVAVAGDERLAIDAPLVATPSG